MLPWQRTAAYEQRRRSSFATPVFLAFFLLVLDATTLVMLAIICKRMQRWVSPVGIIVPQRTLVRTHAIHFCFVLSRQRRPDCCSASQEGSQWRNGRDYEHAHKALSSCSIACSFVLLMWHNPPARLLVLGFFSTKTRAWHCETIGPQCWGRAHKRVLQPWT